MKKIIISALTFLVLPCVTAQANSGVYGTLEAGLGTQQGLPSQAEANAVYYNNSSPGLRASLGYNHDFSKYWGLGAEAALGRYGDTNYTYADGTSNQIKSSTSEYLGVVMLHLQPVDIFVKAGETRQRMSAYGVNTPPTGSGVHPELALGTAYNITKHFAATVTYAHVFGEQVESISDLGGTLPGLNELLFGLRINFT